MADFSWSDSLQAALAPCVGCFRSRPSDDDASEHGPEYVPRARPDELEGLLADADADADPDGWDDSEPYVIYTASPRSPSSPSPSPSSPALSPRSPARYAPPPPPALHKPRWAPHSRHSSLTSIVEEEEDEGGCAV